MMENIYIIEELWLDSMENEVSSAIGYDILGYTDNEEEAINFCNKGTLVTQKYCWAISTPLPQYRYKKIQKI